MCRGNLDENDHFSTMQVLRVVENERSALNSPDIRMEVQLSEDFSLLAEFEIRQTMRDMKMQQEEDGLGLNTFPCTLCDANKSEIRSPDKIRIGFRMNRTTDGLHQAGHLARVNPGNLNREQLGSLLKGSKAVPLTSSTQQTARCCYEALHFKLAMARWIKNIFARINAGLNIWSIDKELRKTFTPHEDHLISGLCKVLGIQRRLQIQGNEAEKILNPRNIEDVLSLITNSNHLTNMRFLLTEVSYFNVVIQSLKPKEHHSIAEFDQRAKAFQLFLLEKYPWISWPDYLHVALCHTAEILNVTDSISRYSAQSKEGKNRLTRIFKEHFARKSSNDLNIQDVMTRDWCLSSPILRDHGAPKVVRRRRCKM